MNYRLSSKMNAACIKFFLPVLLLIHTGLCHGQEISDDPGYSPGDIKSARLHREEWNLSYPVISLGSGEKLVLYFDLLDDNVETYYYTFTHCDKDWNPSGVFESVYLQGFVENRIEDYEMSFNTTVNYIHYSLSFPNNDVSFKISGNYIISVYPFGEPDRPVLTKRFMVSENEVSINASAVRSKLTDFYLTGQELDFSVEHSGLSLQNPYNYVYSTVLKNGRWDNARANLKPAFTGNKRLDYNGLSNISVFPGGSEYRYFDTRSLRYQTEYVRKIENINGYYHVLLKESQNRAARGYFYNQDFNGKYFIAHQEGINPHTDADYVYVYFTLPAAFPIDRDVYVFGELTGWEFNEKNRMVYNTEAHNYECRLLLKQGWYNYIYAVPDDRPGASIFSEFEGDHYETENDYIILVYYRDPGGRYDRLIGHHILNTSNNRP
ncbi:MAG: DUF5103 domain-containing protein [Spirochaetales bacterium]|jgi:hypothetical protein|nr:DUF5103 domain-containing protein [Spirochaetales bacterium]